MNKTANSILILTGSIGSGHVSVARAIKEAIHRRGDPKLHVEVVDLMTAFSNFVTKATKSVYLGSLKISPKIYELLFHGSDVSEWPLKFLNFLNAPLMQQKFLEFLEEKRPTVLVSTYPVWDLLIKKVWQRYWSAAPGQPKKLPFVSVITDSISVHNSWMMGNPDYFLVANDDTGVALKNFGVEKSRIKVFGYPVAERFSHHSGRDSAFMHAQGLSSKKKTLLLILSTGTNWSRVKLLIKAMRKSRLKNIQLAIVACADPKWKLRLEKMAWPWPTAITGWTNEMHRFIDSADIVLTKAGGATVMECIANAKPMVIIDALPGQEVGNAALVQKYNLGVVLDRNFQNFSDAVTYVFKNLPLIKKNLASQQKPDAGPRIAKFLAHLGTH